jgi:hypothetical protein
VLLPTTCTAGTQLHVHSICSSAAAAHIIGAAPVPQFVVYLLCLSQCPPLPASTLSRHAMCTPAHWLQTEQHDCGRIGHPRSPQQGCHQSLPTSQAWIVTAGHPDSRPTCSSSEALHPTNAGTHAGRCHGARKQPCQHPAAYAGGPLLVGRLRGLLKHCDTQM